MKTAGDWVRLKPHIEQTPRFFQVKSASGLTDDGLVARLYRLAGWFGEHGKDGRMRHLTESTIDHFARCSGLAAAMLQAGWLRHHANGNWTPHGFCDTGAVRKGISAKVRADVLASGICAACPATTNLVVDHIVPVARGGTSERANLQCLCAPCNRSKWKLLPSEWRQAA